MRHVSKFMVSVAAVAALSVVSVASAFADYNELSGVDSSDSEDYITVEFDAVSDLSGGSQTLLVLDTELTDEWDESNIKYIDQNDDGDITSFVLPSDAEGTYYIYVGGNGEVWSGTVEIGSSATVEYVVGDTNGDKMVLPADITNIAKYVSGSDRTTAVSNVIGTFDGDKSYVIGDTNGDAMVLPADITNVAKYVSGADRTTAVGSTVDVTVAAE